MLLFTSLYLAAPSGSNLFFLSSLLMSHRSRISAAIQVFFLLMMFAKDLTGCFSHCCVESGDHWIYVCIFVARDGERCKPPAYHSLEGFRHAGIFQLFEVKLESCVFWLADFFFRRRRKVIISKTWSLPMYAPGKLRVLAMFTPDRKRFSLECNQFGCGVVHLGYAMSIFWMLCDDQMCSQTQDR